VELQQAAAFTSYGCLQATNNWHSREELQQAAAFTSSGKAVSNNQQKLH